jgi:hypothetical protein
MGSNRASRYQVNQPHVAAEEIQGEVVVVSFATGRYYSMRNTAAEVWHLLIDGATPTDVIEAFGDPPTEDRTEAVARFVDTVIAEGLLIATADTPTPLNGHRSVDYVEPVLEQFDGMKAMLLYDPIHDVDDTGWPTLPESPPPL